MSGENVSPDPRNFRSMDSACLRRMLDHFLDILHENGFWHQEVLISKDGIRKPAFYGFEFFNRPADYLIYHDENTVVTTNLHDSYSIIMPPPIRQPSAS